jgi:hypothetical protein
LGSVFCLQVLVLRGSVQYRILFSINAHPPQPQHLL